MPDTPVLRLFSRGAERESRRVADVLRAEATGGVLLAVATLVAVVWANSPWRDAYTDLQGLRLGPSALHLDLPLSTWAADGLLAVFFFVAGLEVKREFVAGDLRDPRRAVLPVVAAVGGMAVPAALYLAVTALGDGDPAGWAVPIATDIAFAVAVLAVIGTALPAALRTFLLTLAVVDDLLAIAVIALVYSEDLAPLWLLAALVPIAVFGVLVQRRVRTPWLLVPLAVLAWVAVHEAGVHATVAGVLLAFTVPVRRRDGGDGPGLAEHLEHVVRPLSAGVAVPVFALLAAGVHVGGWSGLGAALTDPVALGVAAGLLVGKPVGILLAAGLVARFTRADLDPDLTWSDVAGTAVLAGIGFTVSLLIGELAFGVGTEVDEHVKVGVLAGSLLAALAATVVLRRRDRHHRRSTSPSVD